MNSLKQYIEQFHIQLTDSRAIIEQALADIEEFKAQRTIAELDPRGSERERRAKVDELTNKIDESNSLIWKTEYEFGKKAAAMRRTIENDFKPRAKASEINSADCELIRLGILGSDELLELADKYSGNIAMTRVVCQELKRIGERDKNSRLIARADIIQKRENEALNLFDGYMAFANSAMRQKKRTSQELCRAMTEQLEKRMPEFLATCEDVVPFVDDHTDSE